ncbi:MAG TPA: CHAT domain-containing protein, partial [Rudaea sp.]
VVLEYWLGESRSYLWRITHDSVRSWVLPPRATIEHAADALREKVLAVASPTGASFEQLAAASGQSDPEIERSAQSLASELLPAGLELPEHATIAIVADGELQRTPFQLFGSIAKHGVVYLPSLAIVQELRATNAARAAAPSIALFADPVFDPSDPRIRATVGHDAASSRPELASADTHAATWRRLKYTQAEADAIAALFAQSQRFVASGFAASRQAALAFPWLRYDLVHFATHAVIDLRHPDLSGVVLSLFDAQGARQDGFLRMNDIYRLSMAADLVVLSVCDSTRERGRGAEGMFGLSRAFFYAGARRLLVSLWPVDDQASAQFMASFYRHLIDKKQPPQEALRSAQIQMRDDPRWRAPYYWAGFVLHGDWQDER